MLRFNITRVTQMATLGMTWVQMSLRTISMFKKGIKASFQDQVVGFSSLITEEEMGLEVHLNITINSSLNRTKKIQMYGILQLLHLISCPQIWVEVADNHPVFRTMDGVLNQGDPHLINSSNKVQLKFNPNLWWGSLLSKQTLVVQ